MKYNVGDLIVEDMFLDPKINRVNLITWADEEHVELLTPKYNETHVYNVKQIEIFKCNTGIIFNRLLLQAS